VKICDLTQFYSPVSGGVKRYLEQKVAFLRRHYPEDRHVLIVPGAATERKITDLSTVHTIRSPLVSRTSRYRMLLHLNQVERILEEEKPDIIESGDPYQMAWKAIFSGRALGIPVVGFYHSHFPEAYIRSVAKYFGKIALYITTDIAERYVRHLYNRFQRTLVPSPALAALLTEWGVDNARNIDLGVDTKVFYPLATAEQMAVGRAALENELSIPSGKILLLYTGRLASEKNVRTLFEAFARLHRQSPGRFHLLAVGDGTLRSALRRLQESTGAVSWTPYCSEAERLACYYRAADLFVHPSINETFGLVTLESQACGTPVVGIRGSYMDRIIFTDQAHWAAENTATALAEAIRYLAGQDLRQAGREAATTVHQRYSWDAVFTSLREIYQEVIDSYSA
jgi:alpha-1,6-mannosyltransferase